MSWTRLGDDFGSGSHYARKLPPRQSHRAGQIMTTDTNQRQSAPRVRELINPVSIIIELHDDTPQFRQQAA